jgi:prepilin-type N-terminal cleavage/methylation domain-containing protein
MKINSRQCNQGFSLTELMCVLAIVSILAALYLPAIARAFSRVRNFLKGF